MVDGKESRETSASRGDANKYKKKDDEVRELLAKLNKSTKQVNREFGLPYTFNTKTRYGGSTIVGHHEKVLKIDREIFALTTVIRQRFNALGDGSAALELYEATRHLVTNYIATANQARAVLQQREQELRRALSSLYPEELVKLKEFQPLDDEESHRVVTEKLQDEVLEEFDTLRVNRPRVAESAPPMESADWGQPRYDDPFGSAGAKPTNPFSPSVYPRLNVRQEQTAGAQKNRESSRPHTPSAVPPQRMSPPHFPAPPLPTTVMHMQAHQDHANPSQTMHQQMMTQQSMPPHTMPYTIVLDTSASLYNDISIGTFDGAFEEYPLFIDKFKALVDSTQASPVLKFVKLQGSLRGDPLELIKNYPLTNEGYRLAMQQLDNTYNKPDMVKTRLRDKLNSVPKAAYSSKECRRTFNQIKGIMDQLSMITIMVDDFLITTIKRKFPKKFWKELNKTTEAKNSISGFMKALERQVVEFEELGEEEEMADAAELTEQGQVFLTQQRAVQCFRCGGNHFARNCFASERTYERRSHSRTRSPYNRSSTPYRQSSRDRYERPRERSPYHSDRRSPYRSDRRSLYRSDRRSPYRSDRRSPFRSDRRSSSLYQERDSEGYRERSRDRYRSSSRDRRPYSRERNNYSERSGQSSRRTPDRERERNDRYREHSRERGRSRERVRDRGDRESYRRETDDHWHAQRDNRDINTAQVGGNLHRRSSRSPRGSRVSFDHRQYHTDVNKSAGQLLIIRTAVLDEKQRGHQVECMLDCGATKSLIEAKLARKLCLPVIEHDVLIKIGGFAGSMQTVRSDLVEVTLEKDGHVLVCPMYTANDMIKSLPPYHADERDIKMLERYGVDTSSYNDPQILIGIDVFFNIMNGANTIKLPSGRTMVQTSFGTAVCGCTDEKEQVLQYSGVIDEVEIDTDMRMKLGEQMLGESLLDDEARAAYGKARERFRETVKIREDGTIAVTLPFKKGAAEISDNVKLARSRLFGLLKQARDNPKLCQLIDEKFSDMERRGTIEKVQEGPDEVDWVVFLLPYHIVFNDASETTSARIVFDASAKMKGERSLNDVLECPEISIPEIPGILMRTRMASYLLSSDIEKCFHAVEVQPEYRSAVRFLRLKKGVNVTDQITADDFEVWQFCKLPFGLSVSPWLLEESIAYGIDQMNLPDDVKTRLLRNRYVDNGFATYDDPKRTEAIYREQKEIYRHQNMNLRQFASNDPHIKKKIPEEDLAKNSLQKVLGVQWDTVTDTYSIKKPDPLDPDRPITKRILSAYLGSVYDPTNRFLPLTAKGRMALQDAWQQNPPLGWDEPISDANIIEAVQEMVNNVERARMSYSREIKVKGAKHELCIFTDASTRMYACVAYLRSTHKNGQTTVEQINAKAKLAPSGAKKKRCTIPELELCGLVIGAKLAEYISSELDTEIDSIHMFSDSTIALQWLESPKDRKAKGVFVENRVNAVNKMAQKYEALGKKVRFYHVNGSDNPADHPTRGLTVEEVTSSNWYRGPQWLTRPVSEWLTNKVFSIQEDECTVPPEQIITSMTTKIEQCEEKSDFVLTNLSQSNNWTSLRMTAGYVMRFILAVCTCLKRPMKIPELSMLTKHDRSMKKLRDVGEHLLIRLHQELYIDKIKKLAETYVIEKNFTGLFMQHTRLLYAMDAPPYRIVIIAKSRLCEVIIHWLHITMAHAGHGSLLARYQDEFFSPRVRARIRACVQACMACRKVNALPFGRPPQSVLPPGRVNRDVVFSEVGCDYAGPISVRVGKQICKGYILIFSCLATRLTHLELVLTQGTGELMLAMRRMASTWRQARILFSDNGTSFVLANKLLSGKMYSVDPMKSLEYELAKEGCEWRFNVPLAPHFAGVYERIVGCTKKAIRASLGSVRIPSYSELQTLLVEAARLVNCRPLIYRQGINYEDVTVLRPIDCCIPYLPSPEYEKLTPFSTDHAAIVATFNTACERLNRFWHVFKNEYLLSDRAFHKAGGTKAAANSRALPEVGEVVLIKSDNMPRNRWRLAKVTGLKESRDGQIRSARLMTYDKGVPREKVRAVEQLIPIEVRESPTKTTKKKVHIGITTFCLLALLACSLPGAHAEGNSRILTRTPRLTHDQLISSFLQNAITARNATRAREIYEQMSERKMTPSPLVAEKYHQLLHEHAQTTTTSTSTTTTTTPRPVTRRVWQVRTTTRPVQLSWYTTVSPRTRWEEARRRHDLMGSAGATRFYTTRSPVPTRPVLRYWTTPSTPPLYARPTVPVVPMRTTVLPTTTQSTVAVSTVPAVTVAPSKQEDSEEVEIGNDAENSHSSHTREIHHVHSTSNLPNNPNDTGRIVCGRLGVTLVDFVEQDEFAKYSLCAAKFCIQKMDARPSLLVELPEEVLALDYAVRWRKHDGDRMQIIRTTCPRTSVCDMERCTVCLVNMISNSQCHVARLVIVIGVILFVPLLIIVCCCTRVGRDLKDCWRECFHNSRTARRIRVRFHRGDEQVAMDRLDSPEQPYARSVVRATHTARQKMTTTVMVCITLAMYIGKSEATCDHAIPISHNETLCGADTCKIRSVAELYFTQLTRSICIHSEFPNKAVQKTQVRFVQTDWECVPSDVILTRNYSMHTDSVRRCPGNGLCVGTKCDNVSRNTHIPELKTAMLWPGTSRCTTACNFLSCLCFSLFNSCLFSRSYAVYQPQLVELFRCKEWRPRMYMQIDTTRPDGTMHSKEISILSGEESVEVEGVKYTTLSVEYPRVNTDLFVRLGNNLAHIPSRYDNPALVCNATGACTLRDTCFCTQSEERMNCRCEEVNYHSLIQSHDHALPILSEDHELIVSEKKWPILRTHNTGAHVQAVMKKRIKLSADHIDVDCVIIQHSEAQGCYACAPQSAHFSIVCQAANETTARIRCEDNFIDILKCGPSGHHNTVRKRYAVQTVRDLCNIRCGSMAIAVPITGTLEYVRNDQLFSESEARSIEVTDGFHFPDIGGAIRTFVNNCYYSVIALLTLVGIGALCYIVGPCCLKAAVLL